MGRCGWRSRLSEDKGEPQAFGLETNTSSLSLQEENRSEVFLLHLILSSAAHFLKMQS